MNTMSSPECGLSVGAKCWMSGNREGRLTLFHAHRYPHDVIGPVTVMWKPCTETNRTLWLWSHPAYYQEVLNELVSVFKLKATSCEDVEMEAKPVENVSKKSNQKVKKPKNVEKTIINLKNVPFSKVQQYSNTETDIVISPLKNTLNRFRLCGSLSNSVLCKALHPAELFNNVLRMSQKVWWKTSEESPSTFQLLEKYSTPSQFPSHVILGSSIIDPRLHLKRKREKAVPSNEGKEF